MLLGLPFSYWLGFGLILWLLYDLFSGVAYIWQRYERATETMMYWFTMVVWALVAASCFIYPHWS